jgi:hypothetical protein
MGKKTVKKMKELTSKHLWQSYGMASVEIVLDVFSVSSMSLSSVNIADGGGGTGGGTNDDIRLHQRRDERLGYQRRQRGRQSQCLQRRRTISDISDGDDDDDVVDGNSDGSERERVGFLLSARMYL